MSTTQYIGARYVPLFADPAEWNDSRTYEPLTIVLHEGNSYTSRQFVPKGITIDNDDFWVLTGNYNAQVEQYRQDVARINDTVNGTVIPAVNKNAEDIAKNAAALVKESERASNKENEINSNVDKIKVRYYSTVEDMKADNSLKTDLFCVTAGFHSENDGGGATYIISDTAASNGFDAIACNDKVAVLVVNDFNVKKFGCSETASNNASIINFVLNKYKKAYIPKGQYGIEETIIIDRFNTLNCDDVILTGNGTGTCINIINSTEEYANYIYTILNGNLTIDNFEIGLQVSSDDNEYGITGIINNIIFTHNKTCIKIISSHVYKLTFNNINLSGDYGIHYTSKSLDSGENIVINNMFTGNLKCIVKSDTFAEFVFNNSSFDYSALAFECNFCIFNCNNCHFEGLGERTEYQHKGIIHTTDSRTSLTLDKCTLVATLNTTSFSSTPCNVTINNCTLLGSRNDVPYLFSYPIRTKNNNGITNLYGPSMAVSSIPYKFPNLEAANNLKNFKNVIVNNLNVDNLKIESGYVVYNNTTDSNIDGSISYLIDSNESLFGYGKVIVDNDDDYSSLTFFHQVVYDDNNLTYDQAFEFKRDAPESDFCAQAIIPTKPYISIQNYLRIKVKANKKLKFKFYVS